MTLLLLATPVWFCAASACCASSAALRAVASCEPFVVQRLRAREFALCQRHGAFRLVSGEHRGRIGLHDKKRRAARHALAGLHTHLHDTREVRQINRGQVRCGCRDDAVCTYRLRDDGALHAHGLHGNDGLVGRIVARGRIGCAGCMGAGAH
jgi:hypothetical protein